MKKLAAILMLATALVAPGAAMARDVTIETTMMRYSGAAAYLAVYLTDPSGAYHSTLWVAGHKTRYYGALRGWAQGASRAGSLGLDGISGASVGGGETLTVHADLADALIDAGYKPDVIVGDMDSVTDDALRCGAELLIHAYEGGEAPGAAGEPSGHSRHEHDPAHDRSPPSPADRIPGHRHVTGTVSGFCCPSTAPGCGT